MFPVLRVVATRLFGLVLVVLAAGALYAMLSTALQQGGIPRDQARAAGERGDEALAVLASAALIALYVMLALIALAAVLCAALCFTRAWASSRRQYGRYEIRLARNDDATFDARTYLFEALGQITQDQRWLGLHRFIFGQKHIAFEFMSEPADGAVARGRMFLVCDPRDALTIDAQVATAYVDTRVGYEFHPRPRATRRALLWVAERITQAPCTVGELYRYTRGRLRGDCDPVPVRDIVTALWGGGSDLHIIRLFKSHTWLERLWTADEEHLFSESYTSTMGQQHAPVLLQVTLVPMFSLFERFARWSFRRWEHHVDEIQQGPGINSPQQWRQLEQGLNVSLRYLFCADIRVVSPDRRCAEAVAGAVQSGRGENDLTQLRMTRRRNLYLRRLEYAAPPILPVLRRIVSSAEMAGLWSIPSQRVKTLEMVRSNVPRGSASSAVLTGRVVSTEAGADGALAAPTLDEILESLQHLPAAPGGA